MPDDSPAALSKWSPEEILLAQDIEVGRTLLREAISARAMPAEWMRRAEDWLDE